MELITPEQREQLIANGAERGADHVPVLKNAELCIRSSCSTPAAPAPGSLPNSTQKTHPSRSGSQISASDARRQVASASRN